MRYELLNGSNLAYIGDAYYELVIRNYLIEHNITKNKDLQSLSVIYVSATAQSMIMKELVSFLSDEEKKIYLRGRNGAHLIHRKNVEKNEYIMASGFEAIIGYLYLKKEQKRLDEIINKAIMIVEKNNDNIWKKYSSGNLEN